MIAAVEYLAEGTFTKRVDDFVSEGQVIMHDDLIISTLVVVAVVISRIVQRSRVLRALATNIVHAWVIQNFLALKLGKVLCLVALEDSWCRHISKSNVRRLWVLGMELTLWGGWRNWRHGLWELEHGIKFRL